MIVRSPSPFVRPHGTNGRPAGHHQDMTALTLPDPVLVLLVGPAGSGKSTLARRLFPPGEILSSDAFRAAIAGDEADQRATGPAFAALGRALERRLDAGRRTVIDATNVRAADRARWLATARRRGIAVAAIVLDLPRDIILARNAGRARVVDEEVIDRHLAALRRTLDGGALMREGVDPIVVLRTPEAMDALTLADVPASRAR
jgi:protein phosphatase